MHAFAAKQRRLSKQVLLQLQQQAALAASLLALPVFVIQKHVHTPHASVPLMYWYGCLWMCFVLLLLFCVGAFVCVTLSGTA
jgi:hypothetical protein